jgi:poly-gamma-glutamate capsule biosynthesis protein CapA/YwtB (metallophosphatase superfamily)
MMGVVKLFLCGDVMTGRGIDQVLPHPSVPTIYEPYLENAGAYVELAEQVNGPIPKPADYIYVWGDALEELEKTPTDVKLINLETSITKSEEYWPGKGINYRMHPKNVPFLTEAGIDVCALANNHGLDWSCSGLTETLATLNHVDVKSAGAGASLEEAQRPAVVNTAGKKSRVIVVSCGHTSSGIPRSWAADENRKTITKESADSKTFAATSLSCTLSP